MDAINDDHEQPYIKIGKEDDQPWQEQLRKTEGIGLSNQIRLQKDVISQEVSLCKHWCSEVRSFVSDMVNQTNQNDSSELEMIEEAMVEIDRRHEQQTLVVETIASIYVVNERKMLLSLNQERRMLLEFASLNEVAEERLALHKHIFHYFDKQRRDARLLCGRMPSLLQHTGNLMQLSCNRIFNQQRCSLVDRMKELNLDQDNAFLPSAIYTPIRCKVSLNPEDCHAFIVLTNSGFTALHMDPPSECPRWGCARAMATIAPFPRHPNHRARRLIKTTLESLRNPSRDFTASTLADMLWMCLRSMHSDTMNSERTQELLEAKEEKELSALALSGAGAYHRSDTSHIGEGHSRPGHHRRSSSHRLSMHQDMPMSNLFITNDASGQQSSSVWLDPVKGGSLQVLRMTLELMGYLTPPNQQPLEHISSHLQLRSRTIDLVQMMEQKSQAHDRFYLEAIATGSNYDWMIGVTSDTISRPDYMGQDRLSMGVASDGRAYFNGQSMIFAGNIRPGNVVGVLIDMFNGAFVLFKDGVEIGPIFGRGSRAFPAAMVDLQIQLLTTGVLIPGLAIRGLQLGSTNSASTRRKSKRGSGLNEFLPAGTSSAIEKRAPPQVSINFGQLPFSFPVPASTPVEKCRVVANEADMMTQVDDDVVLQPVLQASVRKVVTEGDGDMGAMDGDEERSPLRPLPTQESFLKGIDCHAPIAFSLFPPDNTRILQAAIIIQKSVRSFLLRVRQAFFQRDVIQARMIKKNAAIFIQKTFRGNRSRKITSIVRRKKIPYLRIIEFALRIQRQFRSFMATPSFKKRKEERDKISKSRQGPHTAYIYGKLGGNRPDRLKVLNLEATKLQKVWRGKRVRVAFFNQNPIDAIRLNNLGFALRSRLQTLRLFLIARPFALGWLARVRTKILKRNLEKAMRIIGRSIRQYILRSRLDEMMDATLSEPLKKFLYLLGVDGSSPKKVDTTEQNLVAQPPSS